MTHIKLTGVDEDLVNRLWDTLSAVGGLYSIADGANKLVLRKVLFSSSFVVEAPGGVIRAQDMGKYIELHPIIFGVEMFRNAQTILDEITELCRKLFHGKPVCCIIPLRMRSAQALAHHAGMRMVGEHVRKMTGSPVRCAIYSRGLSDGF
jgi:hypothetical protein